VRHIVVAREHKEILVSGVREMRLFNAIGIPFLLLFEAIRLVYKIGVGTVKIILRIKP
jgi:hypothetical protein